MATAGDPARLGVVASFARPGGNLTGVTLYGTELNGKRIELFREAIPGLNGSKPLRDQRICFGAGGGTRTHTTLPSRDFKSLASTSSATSATLISIAFSLCTCKC